MDGDELATGLVTREQNDENANMPKDVKRTRASFRFGRDVLKKTCAVGGDPLEKRSPIAFASSIVRCLTQHAHHTTKTTMHGTSRLCPGTARGRT